VTHRCGTIGLAGRPNTGKSSLLNRLVGEKVSIVSSKAQTTRHLITGILTTPDCQYIFVDAPGQQLDARNTLNRRLNRRATEAARDADVAMLVVEALRFGPEDQAVLDKIPQEQKVVAVVNKIDTVKHRAQLLPYLDRLAKTREFAAIVPLSGLKRDGLDQLPELLSQLLPVSPLHFPVEQVTDRSEQFQATEIIREKLTWRLNQELPYGITVQIERFAEEEGRLMINAIIWVERSGQKAIVIGQGGERLKEIGRAARLELRHVFGKSVHLELWVKVKENWSDSEAALRQLGFE